MVPTFAAAVFAVSPAWAHRVNVWAFAQGRKVVCQGYFAGGAKPKNCPIRVLLPDGATLVEGKTDDEGQFTFEATVRADLKIILDCGEGHRAEYPLPADRLPEDLPPPGAEPARVQPSKGDSAGREVHRGPASAPHATPPVTTLPAAFDEDKLQGLVRGVIQDELLPLRRDLMDLQDRGDRPGPTEIIGGIGYILGLMGVVAYFRSKAPRNKRPGSP